MTRKWNSGGNGRGGIEKVEKKNEEMIYNFNHIIRET